MYQTLTKTKEKNHVNQLLFSMILNKYKSKVDKENTIEEKIMGIRNSYTFSNKKILNEDDKIAYNL